MKKIFLLCLPLFITTLSCTYDVKEPEPSAACSLSVSFDDTIKPIIESNCAISGCHNGSQEPDLRSYAEIIRNKESIKTRTSDRSMPLGRTLTQTQIDAISCWVQQGALNN